MSDVYPEPVALRNAFRRMTLGYLSIGRTIPVFADDWRLVVSALEEQEAIWEKDSLQSLADIAREEIERIRALFDKKVPQ